MEPEVTTSPPANVEVELMPLMFKRVDTEVEPVMSAPPADTVNCWPDVILPVDSILLVELM